MPRYYPKSLWSSNPFPSKCVLYLPLWSPALRGSIFKSVDPIGHVCTVTGTTIAADGRVFDGDDVVTIPDHASLNFGASTDFSIALWAKRTTTGDTIETFLSKGDSTRDGATWFTIESDQDAGTGTQRVKLDDNVAVKQAIGATDLRDSTWHLIGFSADRSGAAFPYLDGSPDGAGVSISALGDIDHIESLRISSFSHDGTLIQYFNGSVAELWIWRGRVLSAAEWLFLYRMTKGRYV